jgi:hypothetical protein
MARRMVTVDLEGGDELNGKLNALAECAQGPVLEDAGLEGVAPFLEAADLRVARKRGVLASSLGANVMEVDEDHADVDAGALGSNIAHVVEYGHVLVTGGKVSRAKTSAGIAAAKLSGDFTGTIVGHVPAHPFLRPAYDETKDQMVSNVGDRIREAVEAAAKS